MSLEDDVNPNELTGNYLSPEEFFKQMQEEDTVVIDARNDYEFDVGHFRGAIRPDIENFRDCRSGSATTKSNSKERKS